MLAIRLHTANGPAGLTSDQVDTPEPRSGEVLVRVKAAAITRDELDWPANRLPAVPSYEFSGMVAGLGLDTAGFSIGDEVFGLGAFDRDGAAAEYIVVQKEFLASKPGTVDHINSASVPLAALSAWQGLFDHGQLAPGQRVLIHGAAGGVGSFAVQLAHYFGAYVIGTASGRNMPAVRTLGADEVLDAAVDNYEEKLHKVDLVFDTVGAARLDHSLSVIRRGGKLISVAAEPSQDRARAHGVYARFFVVSPNRGQLVRIAKLIDSGAIKPAIDSVFPISEYRQAFEHSLSPHGVGKVVLRVTGD